MRAIVLIQVGDDVVVAWGEYAGAIRVCTRTGNENTRGALHGVVAEIYSSSAEDGECYVSKRRALTTKGPLGVLGDGKGMLKGKEKRGGRCLSNLRTTQLGCMRENREGA